MADSADHFHKFIRRLHRRQVAARVLERVGLSVLGGCALAILLMLILFFRARPAMPVAVVGLVLSVFAGLIWGFLQRPSLLATAIEADRQLQLADLLSTAWTIRLAENGDPWLKAILAAANDRCRLLATSSVLLNRLNPRIWGGAGLATALMLTIGVMAANPLTSVATGTLPADGPRDGAFLERPDHSQIVFAPASSRDPFSSPGRDADEEMRNGPGEGMTEDGQDKKDTQSNQRDSAAGSGASAEGTGAGSAQSSTHKNDHAELMAAGTGATAGTTGHTAAGTGQGTDAATGAGTTGGRGGEQSAIAEAPAWAAPAWSGPSWPADREAAMKAVETRRLPGGYREMVRAYFERRDE